MLSFAYPVLSFSLSNLELEGKWWEGGEHGRKREVLGWVTWLRIKYVLFEAFIPTGYFWWINWQFSETLTVLVISLFRPPQLSNEVKGIKASETEWRRGCVMTRGLICVARVTRWTGWAAVLVTAGWEGPALGRWHPHLPRQKGLISRNSFMCWRVGGSLCGPPLSPVARWDRPHSLTSSPLLVLGRCVSYT